jgi:hypothetical protein
MNARTANESLLLVLYEIYLCFLYFLAAVKQLSVQRRKMTYNSTRFHIISHPTIHFLSLFSSTRFTQYFYLYER